MKTIAEWLESLGLGEYAERFAENAIDLSIVGDLTEQDLRELEIPLGHRRKLLRAIAELNGTAPERPRPPEPAKPPEPAPKTVEAKTGAQRRQITVMFCDLVGSTALSARLDPEDMRAVIGAYHNCMGEVMTRYQALIARYMGDGAMIYFGYPQAHEDDAVQAAHAGLALVDALSRLETHVDATLQARVGIATGMVVVGDLLIGEDGQERGVVGDTPNLAARLQTVAEPGTVVICPNTRRLTEGHFEYRDLGALPLKGFAAPTPAWQVVRPSGVESRFEAQHVTKLMPLLGRDEELDLLARRWKLAKQGEGRVILLTGEPGIGKSHILLALEEQLAAEPHIKLSYFCSPHHNHSALFPFIGQLERAARFERGDSPTQKYAKLETLLAQCTGHGEHALALLADLLSLPPDPRHPMPQLSPQKRKEATLAAISAQLDTVTAQQPVLMLLEDIHWIDPTSLDLLAMTVERAARLPVLLLISARPEFTPAWPSHAHVTTIPLTRLGQRDGAALVDRVAGGKPLPAEVIKQILARTDGVPLFVEELTKTVLESGQLQEREGRYVLDRPLPSLTIPTTLHASLTARLDRLASVREVAQIGAVVGREFSYEILCAVAGQPKEELEEALDQLVQSELIFRRGELPQAIYSFKHALVRDAAYGGLLKSRRAQLHAAIAEALEQRFPEIVKSQPETLAHHLTEAGLADKAVKYWLQAGRNAALRSANLEAIAHLERGIEAAGRLPESAGRDRLALDLELALGPCLIATQGPAGSKAVATFARARALCERLGDPPEYLQVMFWITTASVMRGELPQAQEAITALLARADARGDRPALLNATRGQAMILMFMGRIVEAGEVIERALAAFNASGEEDRLAARAAGQDAGVADLALSSWTHWLLGHVDTGAQRISAAFERADAIDHPHSRAYAYYYASVLYALRGEPQIAHGCAERCLALAEEHEFRQWRGLSRAIKGICRTALDPSSSAIEEVTRALDEYRNAGYQLGITALHVLLCPALLLARQYEGALEVIDQGLSAVSHNTERIFEAELYRLKAHALLAAGAEGAPAEADALLHRALATAKAQQARSLELRAVTDLAKMWLDRGERQAARNVLAPVHGWFSEGHDTQDLRLAKGLLDGLR